MDVLDSVRRAVRHYPGGLDAVALRLGKSPSTLEKELRAAPQYKLGAMDAAEIAAMCTQLGTPHALDYPTRLAEHCGATLLPLPHGLQPDSITAGAVAGLMRELADVVGAVAAADADGDQGVAAATDDHGTAGSTGWRGVAAASPSTRRISATSSPHCSGLPAKPSMPASTAAC